MIADRYSSLMRLDIDPDHLRICMRLWRDSIDLQIPMRDDFKLHFIERRGELLGGFEKTAAAWLMALRRAAPDADGKADFETLISEIENFSAWATLELKKLTDMAAVEAVRSSIEDLLSDSSIPAALREIARKRKPGGDLPS